MKSMLGWKPGETGGVIKPVSTLDLLRTARKPGPLNFDMTIYGHRS